MQELLIAMAQGLVEFPDQVTVNVDEADEEGVVTYHLHGRRKRYGPRHW